MNRYYLVNVGSAPDRVTRVLERMASNTTNRTLPNRIGHVRWSIDGKWAIVQGYTTDAEHTAILGLKAGNLSYVQLLGTFNESTITAGSEVKLEIDSKPERWDNSRLYPGVQ